MAESFDPYYQWLGIRSNDEPLNHYRLLAIPLFESRRKVISNAADQRLAHVRKFRKGDHRAAAQKICDEIAAARICLLAPEKKEPYDDQLREIVGVPGEDTAEATTESSTASGPPTLPGATPRGNSASASRWFRTKYGAVVGSLQGIGRAVARIDVKRLVASGARGIGRAILAVPRAIDYLLRRLAGEENIILHNFLRCLAIAAVIIAAAALIGIVFAH